MKLKRMSFPTLPTDSLKGCGLFCFWVFRWKCVRLIFTNHNRYGLSVRCFHVGGNTFHSVSFGWKAAPAGMQYYFKEKFQHHNVLHRFPSSSRPPFCCSHIFSPVGCRLWTISRKCENQTRTECQPLRRAFWSFNLIWIVCGWQAFFTMYLATRSTRNRNRTCVLTDRPT